MDFSRIFKESAFHLWSNANCSSALPWSIFHASNDGWDCRAGRWKGLRCGHPTAASGHWRQDKCLPHWYWCSASLYPSVSRADERVQRMNYAVSCTRGLLNRRTALSTPAAASPEPSLHLVTLGRDSFGAPWCPSTIGLGTQLLLSNR